MGNSSRRRGKTPSQDLVGWGIPAEEEEAQGAGVSRDVPPAPTLTTTPMGSQEEVADVDDNFLNGNIMKAITGETQKRGPGRLATTGEHVSKRKKEEEKARVRKEEEKEKRAAEVLSSTAPKGKKWTKVQKEEEELEAELINAPTENIASRLIEQCAKNFKIADCSNSTKGSLVKELQGSVALVRAATGIIAQERSAITGTQRSSTR